MTVESVMEYSCHSWRHVYPTAGAQLDVNPEAVDAMGHWPPGMACVSDLPYKKKVLVTVFDGWDLPCQALAGQTKGDAHKEKTTPAQSNIIFIPSGHAAGFSIQTFEHFAHSEDGSNAQDDGTADTQAQVPRVQ